MADRSALLSDDALLLVLESGGLAVAGVCACTCKDWRRVASKACSAWAIIQPLANSVWEDAAAGLPSIDLSASHPDGGLLLFRSNDDSVLRGNDSQTRITFFGPGLTACHSITKHRSGMPGEWSRPSALVMDGRHHLYTAECDDTFGTHRIQQFRTLQIDLSPLPRAPMPGSDGLALWGSSGTPGSAGDTALNAGARGPQLEFVSSAPLPQAAGSYIVFRGGGYWGGSGEGELMRPMGLALTEDGRRLFVADSGNHRIAVFETRPTLDFCVNIGGPAAGSGKGEFHTPVYLMRHLSELYVCDRDNDRLVVLDCGTLEPTRLLGGPGCGPGRFVRPSRACVCKGRLVVLDAPPHHRGSRVQLLTLSGVPQQVLMLETTHVAMCCPASAAPPCLVLAQAEASRLVRLDVCDDGATRHRRASGTLDAPTQMGPPSVAVPPPPHRTKQAPRRASGGPRAQRLVLARLLLGLPPWLLGALVATVAAMLAFSLARADSDF